MADSPQSIACAAKRIREIALQKEITPSDVPDRFEQWAAALGDNALHDVPGISFLRLWRRRGNLEHGLLRD